MVDKPKFREPWFDVAGFHTLTDEQILTLTLWGEARGSRAEQQIALGEVIMNRVEDGRYGPGVRGVCLKRQAFSCWWEVSVNRDRVLTMATAVVNRERFPSEAAKLAYTQLLALAPGIMAGRFEPLVGDALHYHSVPDDKPELWPWWSKGHKPAYVHGPFKFYVGIDDRPKRRGSQ